MTSALPNRDKPKVAVVCAIGLSVKVLLKPQIDAMIAAGYKVTCICTPDEATETLEREGMVFRKVNIGRDVRPLREISTVWKLYRLFRRERFDIVHTHTPKAAFLAQLAAWLACVPVRINTVHGFYFLAVPPGFSRFAFKVLEVITCRLTHHVFSQSQEDADWAIRNNRIPPDRLEWLGNGIDLSRFNRGCYGEGARLEVRREFGIPPDAFVVGIIARMVREKGLRELFGALKRVVDRYPNVYLLHVGFVDTSRNDEVGPETAEEMGIGRQCRFAGQRSDIPRLLSAMDIYCLPSYREGYPRSVMEANAMGLPAIVTDIRGCREAVIEGVNGLIIPPREVQPLAEAIIRLYEDASLRTALSRGALLRAREAFDERRVIATLLARYEKLLT